VHPALLEDGVPQVVVLQIHTTQTEGERRGGVHQVEHQTRIVIGLLLGLLVPLLRIPMPMVGRRRPGMCRREHLTHTTPVTAGKRQRGRLLPGHQTLIILVAIRHPPGNLAQRPQTLQEEVQAVGALLEVEIVGVHLMMAGGPPLKSEMELVMTRADGVHHTTTMMIQTG
jgi:hypothetical protein